MKRAGLLLLAGAFAGSARAVDGVPATATPAAPVGTIEPRSVVVQQREEGLVFDVPLRQQRSLRDNDPKFDRLLKDLPGLDTEGVPFEKGWTEELGEAFIDQLRNGPPPCRPNQCALGEQTRQRLRGLDTDYGPQDDWTWTPPAGQ